MPDAPTIQRASEDVQRLLIARGEAMQDTQASTLRLKAVQADLDRARTQLDKLLRAAAV